MAAVRELGHDVPALVGDFADRRHPVDFGERDRHAEFGGGGRPAAGAEQQDFRSLRTERTVQFPDDAGERVLDRELRFVIARRVHRNHVVERKIGAAAHGVPLEREENPLFRNVRDADRGSLSADL